MPENGKTWLRLRWRTLFLLAIAGVVGWSGYSYWSEYSERTALKARELMSPTVGARCAVVFTAAALGLERNPPGPAEINGASNAAYGNFVMQNDQWIVLDQGANKPRIWIAREHVMLIRVEQ